MKTMEKRRPGTHGRKKKRRKKGAPQRGTIGKARRDAMFVLTHGKAFWRNKGRRARAVRVLTEMGAVTRVWKGFRFTEEGARFRVYYVKMDLTKGGMEKCEVAPTG